MIRARWNGVTIAESDRTIVIEGNHYFPPEDVRGEYLLESAAHTQCPWKGQASYKTVRVSDQELVDAAWYYADPKPAAKEIKGYIAFWKGVEVG